MTDRELMQQALEALERYSGVDQRACDAEEALRERLAQPEQEPVACQYAKDVAMPEYRCAGKCQYAQPKQMPVAVWELQEDGWETICDGDWLQALPVGTKLYTAPPQRKPLTVEEIKKLIHPIVMADLSDEMTDFEIVRAIEAAHGIGEKPDAA